MKERPDFRGEAPRSQNFNDSLNDIGNDEYLQRIAFEDLGSEKNWSRGMIQDIIKKNHLALFDRVIDLIKNEDETSDFWRKSFVSLGLKKTRLQNFIKNDNWGAFYDAVSANKIDFVNRIIGLVAGNPVNFESPQLHEMIKEAGVGKKPPYETNDSVRKPDYYRVFRQAVKNNNLEMTKLITKTVFHSPNYQYDLFDLISGRKDEEEQYSRSFIRISSVDANRRGKRCQALIDAVEAGNPEMVRHIISTALDPNSAPAFRDTFIDMITSRLGEAFEHFIKNGSNEGHDKIIDLIIEATDDEKLKNKMVKIKKARDCLMQNFDNNPSVRRSLDSREATKSVITELFNRSEDFWLFNTHQNAIFGQLPEDLQSLIISFLEDIKIESFSPDQQELVNRALTEASLSRSNASQIPQQSSAVEEYKADSNDIREASPSPSTKMVASNGKSITPPRHSGRESSQIV